MELNYFKDKLFDLLNDGSDELELAGIKVCDKENTFVLTTAEGSLFEIECRKMPATTE